MSSSGEPTSLGAQPLNQNPANQQPHDNNRGSLLIRGSSAQEPVGASSTGVAVFSPEDLNADVNQVLGPDASPQTASPQTIINTPSPSFRVNTTKLVGAVEHQLRGASRVDHTVARDGTKPIAYQVQRIPSSERQRAEVISRPEILETDTIRTEFIPRPRSTSASNSNRSRSQQSRRGHESISSHSGRVRSQNAIPLRTTSQNSSPGTEIRRDYYGVAHRGLPGSGLPQAQKRGLPRHDSRPRQTGDDRMTTESGFTYKPRVFGQFSTPPSTGPSQASSGQSPTSRYPTLTGHSSSTGPSQMAQSSKTHTTTNATGFLHDVQASSDFRDLPHEIWGKRKKGSMRKPPVDNTWDPEFLKIQKRMRANSPMRHIYPEKKPKEFSLGSRPGSRPPSQDRAVDSNGNYSKKVSYSFVPTEKVGDSVSNTSQPKSRSYQETIGISNAISQRAGSSYRASSTGQHPVIPSTAVSQPYHSARLAKPPAALLACQIGSVTASTIPALTAQRQPSAQRQSSAQQSTAAGGGMRQLSIPRPVSVQRQSMALPQPTSQRQSSVRRQPSIERQLSATRLLHPVRGLQQGAVIGQKTGVAPHQPVLNQRTLFPFNPQPRINTTGAPPPRVGANRITPSSGAPPSKVRNSLVGDQRQSSIPSQILNPVLQQNSVQRQRQSLIPVQSEVWQNSIVKNSAMRQSSVGRDGAFGIPKPPSSVNSVNCQSSVGVNRQPSAGSRQPSTDPKSQPFVAANFGSPFLKMLQVSPVSQPPMVFDQKVTPPGNKNAATGSTKANSTSGSGPVRDSGSDQPVNPRSFSEYHARNHYENLADDTTKAYVHPDAIKEYRSPEPRSNEVNPFKFQRHSTNNRDSNIDGLHGIPFQKQRAHSPGRFRSGYWIHTVSGPRFVEANNEVIHQLNWISRAQTRGPSRPASRDPSRGVSRAASRGVSAGSDDNDGGVAPRNLYPDFVSAQQEQEAQAHQRLQIKSTFPGRLNLKQQTVSIVNQSPQMAQVTQQPQFRPTATFVPYPTTASFEPNPQPVQQQESLNSFAMGQQPAVQVVENGEIDSGKVRSGWVNNTNTVQSMKSTEVAVPDSSIANTKTHTKPNAGNKTKTTTRETGNILQKALDDAGHLQQMINLTREDSPSLVEMEIDEATRRLDNEARGQSGGRGRTQDMFDLSPKSEGRNIMEPSVVTNLSPYYRYERNVAAAPQRHDTDRPLEALRLSKNRSKKEQKRSRQKILSAINGKRWSNVGAGNNAHLVDDPTVKFLILNHYFDPVQGEEIVVVAGWPFVRQQGDVFRLKA